MDRKLYGAATKGDIEVLKIYKGQLLTQVTSPAQNTVLHVIAQYNDSGEAIKEILSDQNFGVLESLLTWKNSQGETALYLASRNRRECIVQELLAASAQVVSPDLEYGDGGVSLTERMVRIPNRHGDTPLHEAANNNYSVIVKFLVRADPNYKHLTNNVGKTPLYIALEKRMGRARGEFFFPDSDSMVISSSDTLREILEYCKSPGFEGPHGETVLHAAARRDKGGGFTDWIGRICNKIPNAIKQDDQGFSPLHYAAAFNNYNAAECLLKQDNSMAYTTASEGNDSMRPLHIAARNGYSDMIRIILTYCVNCWDGLTSKGQNILHLAAQGQHSKCIRYILRQPWAINLVNMKDNNGNTPSHLLLSSNPKSYKTIKSLLEHPNVNVDTLNNEYSTPLQMFNKAETNFTAKKVIILYNLEKKFGRIEKIPWTNNDRENGNSEREVNKTQRLQEMKQTAQTQLLVATLVATMTFAAGFTLPGGYDGNVGPNQGMAVLLRKAAFQAFVVTDTISVISSCVAIFLHFTATLYKNDEDKISSRYSAALMFLVISMISMVITFVTGLYVVLEKSPAIAITICIIGCCGILYLLYLIRKVYRDFGFTREEYILRMIAAIVTVIMAIIVYFIFEIGDDIFQSVKDMFMKLMKRTYRGVLRRTYTDIQALQSSDFGFASSQKLTLSFRAQNKQHENESFDERKC